MKTSNNDLSTAIIKLSEQYVAQYQQALSHLPLVEIDDQWPSPCVQRQFDQDFNEWLPVALEQELSFENVEQALELTLHSSFKAYFNVIFSESLPVSCDEGHLQLLFAWSEDDFARLQQNIIGHVLMKQKLKQEVTLFFAVTDNDDIILSLDNTSGEVWAERVGQKPHKKIADSLLEFIHQLQPDIYLGNEKVET
ncbi:protein Syd [Thalassotalea insulae]|uniref:Protein Syd n=1 Tax=Thalassotalea insulae TaxID=2056778 RepID=A0ABQ6GVP8_9GAMM|nr:SecY-interacting protein [Thalassotalea insulae]GLX79980.1 protein Syd [Thalassotalea insulae]